MTVPGNIDALLLGGQRGYQIERSLRFNSADSAYLNRTPASAGNRKTWTLSMWVKRAGSFGSFGGYFWSAGVWSSGNANSGAYWSSADKIVWFNGTNAVGTDAQITTNQVFRDPSAWYHLVFRQDTTNGTSTDRLRLYVNGVLASVTVDTTPTLNHDSAWNNTLTHNLGGNNSHGTYSNHYFTEINFIDGSSLDASSFGETDTITGAWKPKRYSGSYGTNGFYLNFKDNSSTSALGTDYSGNSNTWTTNNFSVTAGAGNDSMIDVPTPYADGGNGRGNYATLSPLTLGTSCSLTNGNLDASWTSVAVRVNTQSNFGIPTSGKWYWEVTLATNTNGNATFGVVGAGYSPTAGDVGDPASGYALAPGLGGSTSMTKRNNNSNTSWGAATTSFGAGITYGIAVNMDTGSIFFRDATGWMNASNSNDSTPTTAAYTGLSGTYVPAVGHYSIGSQSTAFNLNFGQRAFAYTPPSGFLALNTQNLPEPSIKKPSSYFDTLLYTGNGSARSITGLGFSPDLVWIKERSGADNHRLVDAVRGATKELYSSLTNAEGTDANGLTAFNSDGFSLGTSNSYNENGVTHVAWCWDESATPGFDIVTYTGDGVAGRTVSHSLGVAPSMMIVKRRTTAGASWLVYHASAGSPPQNNFLILNATDAVDASSLPWNNTAPTSAVFTVGTSGGTNNNGDTFVAYLWSEVAGFSKFGSYTGNGSSDGPFVFCGFRPRWVLVKCTSTINQDWILIDSARSDYNICNEALRPNTSDSELTNDRTDFLSNGFKTRNIFGNQNTNGETYIFAAFAESPFKYSLAR